MVVIIIGVLVTVALPRLFGVVEFSRSAEAFAMIATFRAAWERCLLRQDLWNESCACVDDDCSDWSCFDIGDPNNLAGAGAHFVYDVDVCGGNNATMGIKATRNTLDGGNAGDVIKLAIIYDDLMQGEVINKCGTGAFKSIGDCSKLYQTP